MDVREAEQALAQAAHRRRQAIDAGSAPWSKQVVAGICASLIALGLSIDADMIWLWAVLVAVGIGIPVTRGVRLRPTRGSHAWRASFVGTFVLAVLVDIAAQAVVRGLDWPLPNTIGAAAAALTIVLVSWPVQARLAASLRP